MDSRLRGNDGEGRTVLVTLRDGSVSSEIVTPARCLDMEKPPEEGGQRKRRMDSRLREKDRDCNILEPSRFVTVPLFHKVPLVCDEFAVTSALSP